MRKSVKREKELDRSYDYAESYGFSRASANVGFVKRRARRKLRHDEKRKMKEDIYYEQKSIRGNEIPRCYRF